MQVNDGFQEGNLFFKLFDAVYQGDYALASLIASVITVIVLLVEGLAFLITRKGEIRRVSRT